MKLFNQILKKSQRYIKHFITLGALCGASSLWAEDIIDVYGVDATESQHLIQKYAKSIREIEMNLAKCLDESYHGIEQPKKMANLYQQKHQIIKTIKQDGHYAFVDIQTVSYPDKSDIYSTIEIIPNADSPRLKYIHHPYRHHSPSKYDLIKEMLTYQQKVIRLMMTNQLDLTDNCPVYHCAAPFTHPELKPYLALFNHGMQQHKAEVVDTLNHDPDPEHRAAAAFLIGHLRDPHEIVALLSSHVSDPNATVRNNVLRVIGETIWRAKMNQLDASPYMALLDSPYVSDRNKSLIILYTIADSASGKKQIATNNHGRLETLAALKQPNNRDMAIQILKKIS